MTETGSSDFLFGENDWPRLVRYLAGEMSRHERSELETWLRAVPARLAAFEQIRAEWDAVPLRDMESAEATRAVDRISHVVLATPGSRTEPGSNRTDGFKASWMLPAVLAIAASALIVAIGTMHTRPAVVGSNDTGMKVYSTRPGQRANITLGDGTGVILNVASTLRVPASFGKGKRSRTVFLEGEARFTVTHNSSNPFIVNAHGTIVRDLATEFNVRAYNASGVMRVAVKAGRVAVQSQALTPANAAVVNLNQVATIARDALPVVAAISPTDGDFAWSSGELVLRDAPLGEALVELARWYGLEFRAADSSLLKLDVSGKLPAQFNLDELNHLADVIGARATRVGRVVTIHTKNPQR